MFFIDLEIQASRFLVEIVTTQRQTLIPILVPAMRENRSNA
jgi:hypothetical protein